ncbi:Uncharacterised protein [Vibrio cholerae]|nr:Uncharacterised protein [Vibrio cholerae]
MLNHAFLAVRLFTTQLGEFSPVGGDSFTT